jgi:hypothetical protein
MFLNAYIRKETKVNINNLGIYLKELGEARHSGANL